MWQQESGSGRFLRLFYGFFTVVLRLFRKTPASELAGTAAAPIFPESMSRKCPASVVFSGSSGQRLCQAYPPIPPGSLMPPPSAWGLTGSPDSGGSGFFGGGFLVESVRDLGRRRSACCHGTFLVATGWFRGAGGAGAAACARLFI